MSDPGSRPPRRRVVVLALVGVAVWVPLIVKGVRNTLDGNDFTVLHAAARTVLQGGTLYPADGKYMYPPFFAFCLIPLALLPAGVAAAFWLLAKIPLLYYAAHVFVSGGTLPRTTRAWLVGLAPLLVWRCLDSDLVNGNTNVFLLAAVAATLHAARKHRSILSGAALAAATAVKLSPGYLIPVVGASRRWRVASSAVFLTVVFLWLPTLAIPGGPSEAWRGFRTINRTVFDPGPEPVAADTREGSGYLPGQSLRPLLHRWLRPTDATAHDDLAVRINVLDLDGEVVENAFRISALVLALLGVLGANRQTLRWSLAWGSIILLLISPYARKAHFVLLLPAYLLLVESIVERAPPSVGRTRVVLGGLVISVVLGQLSVRALWGKEITALLLGYGVLGVAALAILPAMWIIRPHGEPDPAPGG